MKEAIDFEANVIVSYHPPLFKEFKRISQDNWKDRIVTQALKHNIAIYSPHTAHDAWSQGVNAWLIEGVLSDEPHIPISPTVDAREMFEISGTLAPSVDAKKFRKFFNKVAISDAGELSGFVYKRDVPRLAQMFSSQIQNLKFQMLAGLPVDGTGMGRMATLENCRLCWIGRVRFIQCLKTIGSEQLYCIVRTALT